MKSKIVAKSFRYGLLLPILAGFLSASAFGYYNIGAFWKAPSTSGGVIASVGTLSTRTANSVQSKIFYDGTRWWAFYRKSSTPNSLFYSYSSDLNSWTEASFALTGTVKSTNTMDVLYFSSTNTVLVTYGSNTVRYARGVISGTSVSWFSTDVLDPTNGAASGASNVAMSSCINSSNKYIVGHDDGQGNPVVSFSADVVSATFNDAGDSAGANVFTAMNYDDISNTMSKHRVLCMGLNLLEITNNGTGNVKWDYYNNSTSSWIGSYTDLVDDPSASSTNWGAVQVSSTDVRFLGVSTTSTLLYQKFNGTSWSTLTAPTYPTNGLATNSEIALSTDGTNVWAFVIRGDTNHTISYNKYTGTTWSGWTDLVITAATRSYISVSANMNGTHQAILWTQVNGTNFDMHAMSL